MEGWEIQSKVLLLCFFGGMFFWGVFFVYSYCTFIFSFM